MPDDVLKNPTCIKGDGTVVPTLKVDNFIPAQLNVQDGLRMSRQQSPKVQSSAVTARINSVVGDLCSTTNSPNRASTISKNKAQFSSGNGFSAKRRTMTKSGSSNKLMTPSTVLNQQMQSNGFGITKVFSPSQKMGSESIKRKISMTGDASNSTKQVDQTATTQQQSTKAASEAQNAANLNQSELAKIQPTCAQFIENELLA